MDRKKSSAGFAGWGSAFTRILPAPLLMGLICLLAFLPACKSQSSTPNPAYQQVRPASNSGRLVQNAAYLKRTGRVELAVKDLEEAYLREPGNLELLDVLIQSYEDLGDFDRAQELYEEALSRGGQHPALENNRCYSLYLQSRLGQAEACFRKVLAQQPDNQTARNNLGLVLCRQGREAEALAMWREALNDGEARQRLGQALVALGKEVPPGLAGPAPVPAEPQVAAAGQPTSPPASLMAKSPEPGPQPTAGSAPAPALPTPAIVRTPESGQQQTAGAGPSPASLTPRVAKAPEPVSQEARPFLTVPDQPLAKLYIPAPQGGPAPVASAPTPAASQAVKASAASPPASVALKKPQPPAVPLLTALDLSSTLIEVRNGNGVQVQAREMGDLLASEGFAVVAIGNHIDFGLEETVITYRPEATKVAKTLAAKFFPKAKLEEGGKLSPQMDIRISLGRDLETGQHLARAQGKMMAALRSAPPPAPETQAATPAEHNLVARASRSAASPKPPAPDLLSTEELAQVRIELKNANGVNGLAWEMGGRLDLEGFKVVNVGNHKDYSLEKTVVAYRPEVIRVAQVLVKKHFPGAVLQEEETLPPWTDVRVSLGRDLVAGHKHMAQASPGEAHP